jgi:hypothetical protein
MKQPVHLALFIALDTGILISIKISSDLIHSSFHYLILPVEIETTDCQHTASHQQKYNQQQQRKFFINSPNAKFQYQEKYRHNRI